MLNSITIQKKRIIQNTKWSALYATLLCKIKNGDPLDNVHTGCATPACSYGVQPLQKQPVQSVESLHTNLENENHVKNVVMLDIYVLYV